MWWTTWRKYDGRLFHKTGSSRMIIRSICYFKTRGKRRATKGDKRGRLSTTMWREWKKRAEVRKLTSFERFICVRENLVFDSLIYLEPMERFKNRSNVMLSIISVEVVICWWIIYDWQCFQYWHRKNGLVSKIWSKREISRRNAKPGWKTFKKNMIYSVKSSK